MSKSDNIIDQLVADNKVAAPVSPLKLFMQWLGVTFVSTGIIVAFMKPRPDLAERLVSWLYCVELISLFFVTLTTAITAVWLCYPDLRQKTKMAFLPLLPTAIFALLCAYRLINPATTPVSLEKSQGIDCAMCVISLAIVPGFWMFYLLRRNATVYPQAAGAISFLASASLGLIVLKLVESNDSVLHLIQWHLTPMFLLAAFGAWLGKKYLLW